MIWRSVVALANNSNSCLRHRDWQRKKRKKGKENNYVLLNYFVFRKMQDSESFSDNHGFPLISTTSTSLWPPGMTMTLIWWQGPKTLSKCFNNRCRRPCHFIKNVMKNQKYKLLSIFSFSTHFWQGICLLVLLEIFEQSKVGSNLLNKLAV